ncbi:hypothetical protein KJ966_12855 [bacterium]|nr:hypothetical protein [bacterium]
MKRFMVSFAFIFACCLLSNGVIAQCYLTVDNSGNLDTKAITQISLVQISQYFEPVNEIPPQGIGTNACTYNLSVSEISNGILVTIKGRAVSTYGDSKLRGFEGFQHALFRAIISAKPEAETEICGRHRNIMGTDCAGVAPARGGEITAPGKGILVVRVPHDYRYSQILSSGSVLGEMKGEVVREFEVETDVTLILEAVDGAYHSQEVYTSVQPGIPTRIDLSGFTTAQTKQSTSKEQPAQSHLLDTESEEDTGPAFARSGAFLFGFGLIPVFSYSNTEKDAGLNESNTYQGVDAGAGFNMFMDIYFTRIFGIGGSYVLISATNESSDGDDKLVVSTSLLFITASLWFPLGSSAYSHLGLKGGVGTAAYTISWQQDGKEQATFESTGSASMFSGFFDWGGDIFGGQVGYNVIITDLANSEQASYSDSNYERSGSYLADTSGSGFYISMRWAF